ncbi:LexA family protein [Sphingomonas sp. PB4P5]|uniref:LexA family protein n=1 Tax=Parasphingomonas puruogangriensis TaxID=3096155 RepID=UPI002FC8E19C
MEVATIAEPRFKRVMTPEEIRAALDARGMAIRDLAEATGIQENFLTKSLGKQGRRIQVPELEAIKRVFDDGPQTGDGLRKIPLLGEVPAGKFQLGEQRSGRWLAVSDPETPPNAYALTVKGDSMDLIVPNGATLVIDPDDKELWPGRRFVIQTAEGETTFKEFQADPARLVPCSTNDEHQDIMLGGEPVNILGRVFSYSTRDMPRRRLS